MNNHISKFLSLVLRHKPETIGIKLDSQGWVSVGDVVAGMSRAGKTVDSLDIIEIVLDDEKGRYSLKDNDTMIRANQGHSIKGIDLGLVEKKPPGILFHGTPTKVVSIIRVEGLKPMQRHHVHLSAERKTAQEVGERRGDAFIFEIEADRMYEDGIKFYQSENGVWLTDAVPNQYFRN